ncbi:hypothetical protein VN97_g4905 [Penicillium thymicola]|uniref:Uncharacterized protein n=1 Tax=Penicillium thymicola TaxID=293382 RepID=A0AAI9TJM0_PENTH|nr:hypothetical protein VN97_g4905 [Penicillium thymicola]
MWGDSLTMPDQSSVHHNKIPFVDGVSNTFRNISRSDYPPINVHGSHKPYHHGTGKIIDEWVARTSHSEERKSCNEE